MNAEDFEIIKQAFPNVVVEREGERVIINHFLSIEPNEVEVRSIGRSSKVQGFLAILDNGEDAIELYNGTGFWEAIESLVVELAKFNLRVLQDKIDPCMVPTGKFFDARL